MRLDLADERVRPGVGVVEEQHRPGVGQRGVEPSGLPLDLRQLAQEVGAVGRRLDGPRPQHARLVEVAALPSRPGLADELLDHLEAQRLQTGLRRGPLRIGDDQRLERGDRLDAACRPR